MLKSDDYDEDDMDGGNNGRVGTRLGRVRTAYMWFQQTETSGRLLGLAVCW